MKSESALGSERDPEFWPRVRRLYEALCEETHELRAAMLEELCEDTRVRHAVQGLLASHDSVTDFLSDPAESGSHRSETFELAPGERIGNYEIIREIGRGGMGAVYEAMQDMPARKVALKLLHGTDASETASARFVQEAEFLAQLEHPNVASVYEAGSHDHAAGSLPYFAMEFIEDARSLTRFAEEEGMDRQARVQLFLQVCDAVHSAHLKGILHRDLKPENILVGTDGRARVIDFGIASVFDANRQRDRPVGSDTSFIGTIRYMSPEQLSRARQEADVRSEVYALGVVLYQLLSGRHPYELAGSSISEYVQRVAHQVPAPINDLARSDLSAVVLKAMAVSPEDRYQSVHGFAEDLRRWLSGRPVEAKRDHAWYVVSKAILRHRIPAVLLLIIAVTISASAVTLGFLYVYASTTAESLRETTYQQTIALAGHELRSSRSAELKRLLASCPEDLRGWEWRYYMSRVDESVRTVEADVNVGAAVSRDGAYVAHMTRGGVVRVVRLRDGASVAEVPTDGTFAETIAFSDDGQHVVVATRADEPSYIIDIQNASVKHRFDAEERLKAVRVVPGMDAFLAGTSKGELSLRDLHTGDVVQLYSSEGAWITSVAVSECGHTVAAGRVDGSIETWDTSTAALRLRVADAHRGRVSGVAFAPESARLFSAGWDAELKTWDSAGEQVDVRQIDADVVRTLSISAEGDVLALATPTAIELRDPENGTLVRRLVGHDRCLGAAFSYGPDGARTLVSWSYDSAKLWDVDTPRGEYVLSTRPRRADALAVSPDGSWVATVARGGEFAIHNLESRAVDQHWSAGVERVYRLAVSPSGELLAGACSDGKVRVWSASQGSVLHTIRASTPAFDVDFLSEDRLLFPPPNNEVGVYNLMDETASMLVAPLDSAVTAISASPDTSSLAIGSRDGWVRVFRLDSTRARLVHSIEAHSRPVSALAWSPNSVTLASGGNDAVVRVWDSREGVLEHELSAHNALIKGLEFTPDGTRLVSSAWEGEIRLWDTQTGLCMLRLNQHTGPVLDVSFTPDGDRLLSVGADKTVRVWDAASQRW